MQKYVSLLSADASNYTEVIRSLENINIDGFHFDIMDGHFVKNFGFSQHIIKSLRKLTKLPFEAHLMLSNTSEYIDMFIDSGCNIITVHPQICNPKRELGYIKAKNIKTSIAIDLEVDVSIVLDYIGLIDNILVLSVYTGFGKQEINKKALEKIPILKNIIKENDLDITISVDGGVSDKYEKEIIRKGADILIYGSSLFKKI